MNTDQPRPRTNELTLRIGSKLCRHCGRDSAQHDEVPTQGELIAMVCRT